MALAPLDIWLRLIARRPSWIAPRYLPRVALGLTTSFFGTLVTLPERVVLGPYLWVRFGRDPRLDHKPGVVVITGYYRSGTTHLHYLMSCDPGMKSPRWVHVSTPQGWFLSWLVVRVMMTPFVSNGRPQDDVAFGPEWPSEDDFALNNWALASTLPGRFIVPGQYDHYERFNSLDRLSERERGRWRRTQAAFCWKLLALTPKKRLLLKTPSHTARVAELHRMFGDRLRVIHISRDPDAVVKSNVRMAERLEPYSLEAMPDRATIRERVVAEYVESEGRFSAESAALGPGRVALLRFEDLIADPLGQLRRCYDTLGLGWTEPTEQRFRRYLGTVRDYKPRHGGESVNPPLEPRLAALAERFGHTAPPIDARPVDHAPAAAIRTGRAIVATWVAVPVLGLFWLGWAAIFHDRTDPLMWVLGIALGIIAVRTARRGSLSLGLNSAAAFAVLIAAFFAPVTLVADAEPLASLTGDSAWAILRDGLTSTNDLVYMIFGVVSAFRVGTRIHVRPPGT